MEGEFHTAHSARHADDNRDFGKTLTAVGKKKKKFNVKKKPQTTDYVYCIFDSKHILLLKACERTILTVLKYLSLQAIEKVDRRHENSDFLVFRITSTFAAVERVTQDQL